MENRDGMTSLEVISKESLPGILTQIGIKREEKGASEILIPYICKVREEAEKLGETKAVLQLYHEEFLSAQHMVMEERSKGLKANPFRAAKGIFIMESSTRLMEKYAEENSEDLDQGIRARTFRFLGRYADHKGQYRKSGEYYRKGLEYFNQSTEIEERFNRLEFLGFLSYSLIKQGKVEFGIDLTQKTLREFDDSDEGKWLKVNDYYAWAVWKSGIEIRTAEHIARTKDLEHANLAKVFLVDSEAILRMTDGTTDSFCLRLDELYLVKGLMAKNKL